MVRVELQRKNKGIKGTRPSTLVVRPHRGLAWVRAQTASAAHSFHRAAPGQDHWLEGGTTFCQNSMSHGYPWYYIFMIRISVVYP